MRSLRGTLYKSVILGTTVVFLLAGTVLFIAVRTQMLNQMDGSLTEKAESLARSVEVKHYGLEVDLNEMRIQDLEGSDTPEYLYIGTLSGRLIYRSGSVGKYTAGGFTELPAEPLHDWHIFKGTDKMRSVLITFEPGVDDEEEDLESVGADPNIVIDTGEIPGNRIVLQIFRAAGDYSRFMHVFLVLLLATGLGTVIILSIILWLSIKKGTEPVNTLASGIESISDDDLSVRLEEAMVFRELVPIVEKLNLLLSKLEESFNREKSFTSDAAHELRTPLAGLKSTIEVALARERECEEYKEILNSSLEIVNQLENLVASLLALARLESGQEAIEPSSLEMTRYIHETWDKNAELAREKGLKVTFEFKNTCRVAADEVLLIQVLDEMIRNAVHYTDEGGSVEFQVQENGEEVVTRITNTGSLVDADDACRVFDRFWRANNSRSDSWSSHGLGLPLARKIVEKMNGSLDVETELGGDFTVFIKLKNYVKNINNR